MHKHTYTQIETKTHFAHEMDQQQRKKTTNHIRKIRTTAEIFFLAIFFFFYSCYIFQWHISFKLLFNARCVVYFNFSGFIFFFSRLSKEKRNAKVINAACVRRIRQVNPDKTSDTLFGSTLAEKSLDNATVDADLLVVLLAKMLTSSKNIHIYVCLN